ncbi:MAG: VWA domain-containing protein [Pirellulaceae bacterium]|nr:VWA domain-containing protein [Pirellulaceae bacterium]
MTFAYPQLIILLVIPVILLFWEWVRQGRPLVMPFDDVQQGRGWWLGLPVLVANSIPALLLGLAIILLARPLTYAPPKTQRELTNIQIVLDASTSMVYNTYGPQAGDKPYTRFHGAMDALEAFLTTREGDAFGLTIFSRQFIHWVPLTQDTRAIRMAREIIWPEMFPDEIWGYTYIGRALDGAITPLSRHAKGDRMIILITDGEGEDIGNGRERDVIARLRSHRITVFAIALNDQSFSPALETIATETGGEAFKALTPQTLKVVFDRIDQMKRVEIRETKPETIDCFEPFVPAVLILLGLQVLVLFGLRFTPW